jgi:hypothetical protein
MLQRAVLAVAAILIFGAPSMALTAQEKMATCQFGADNQKLTGAKRKAFMAKCMADEDTHASRAKPQ